MSELVEECCELIVSDECRSVCSRLCEVTYDSDERTILYAVSYALTAEVSHPCTASLACAREEVSIEERKMCAVCILDLINLYILVIYRDIVALLKSDSIKACCKAEHCINAAFELEVRLEFLCAERVLCLLVPL